MVWTDGKICFFSIPAEKYVKHENMQSVMLYEGQLHYVGRPWSTVSAGEGHH